MVDFIIEYILPVFLVILVAMVIVIVGIFIFEMINGEFYTTRVTIHSDYIHNLETKLNIYEEYNERGFINE